MALITENRDGVGNITEENFSIFSVIWMC